ncbi:MAG: FAD-dependent oxidoreductase [Bacteroidales bacterium]|nr:FAD-dependent oxidoreductase [Bacteroidales bacterium]
MRKEFNENRQLRLRFLILIICGAVISSCTDRMSADILVAGGGTGGVAAGIQAARMGVSTVIVEEHEWLGGMLTSAGVSATDGNYNLRSGIWGEFVNALADHYGGDSLLRTGWVSNILFEPSVGNMIFSRMAEAESYLKVVNDAVITKVKRRGDTWKVTVRRGNYRINYTVKILIDATELGDIAARCGADYDIGMDSRYDTGEEIAPEKANDIVQDLTYVAILKDYGTEVQMERPEGYDSSLFACACINPLCTGADQADARWPCDKMITYGKLPGNKYMINWPISGNDYYVNLIELDREGREEALRLAKQKTLCFLYFINHELGYSNLALADDEFPTPDRLPFIPYYRESRRIKGLVRFNLNHITHPYGNDRKLYRTAIAVGDYPVDHHHSAYSGTEELPDLSFRHPHSRRC